MHTAYCQGCNNYGQIADETICMDNAGTMSWEFICTKCDELLSTCHLCNANPTIDEDTCEDCFTKILVSQSPDHISIADIFADPIGCMNYLQAAHRASGELQ
jgi:hypothetical protein